MNRHFHSFGIWRFFTAVTPGNSQTRDSFCIDLSNGVAARGMRQTDVPHHGGYTTATAAFSFGAYILGSPIIPVVRRLCLARSLRHNVEPLSRRPLSRALLPRAQRRHHLRLLQPEYEAARLGRPRCVCDGVELQAAAMS